MDTIAYSNSVVSTLGEFQYSVCCLAKLVQFPDQTRTDDMQKSHLSNLAVNAQLWRHSHSRSHEYYVADVPSTAGVRILNQVVSEKFLYLRINCGNFY